MKHVFLVHTPITYLVSISVIKQLELKKDNCVILFQSFQNPAGSEYENYSAINIDKAIKSSSLINRVSEFNIPIKVDAIISSATAHEKFIAYIPVVTSIQKILITHKNCIGFNFIEEGLAHYYKEETLETINPSLSTRQWREPAKKNLQTLLHDLYFTARGYNFKLQALPFSYSCYQALNNIKYYRISGDAFPLVTNDKKVTLDFKKENFENLQPGSLDIAGQYIWIGDPGTVHYKFNESTYLEGIKNGCISFLKKNNAGKIFIKYHRDEPPALREAVKNVFTDSKIEVIIIPDSTIMELLFLNTHDTKVLGVYSSLLYYAGIMNQQSFSIFNFLQPEYRKAIANRDFSFFWKKVQLL